MRTGRSRAAAAVSAALPTDSFSAVATTPCADGLGDWEMSSAGRTDS